MEIIAYTDGASRGNPGRSAIGAIIKADKEYNISKFIGIQTNNYAEYTAILETLRLLEKEGYATKENKLHVYLDSELATKQLNGEYKVKNEDIKSIFIKVKAIERKFDSVTFEWIRRSDNVIADALANNALDE